jgi:glutamyl-tRNA reductase
MKFYAFGLNHETASVALTEQFSLDASAQQMLYDHVELSDGAEWMLVSTCNRMEAYLHGTDADLRRLKSAFALRAGRPWPENAFCFEDEDAVRHVLHVTSGIRSLVLGDGQILSQLKDAYRVAVDAGTVDTLLHRLMHAAFRAAKRVATETALSSGAASVSSAAVAMARHHFEATGRPSLDGARVALVGAGKMGRLALTALGGHAIERVTITNRSPERAERVAADHQNAAQTVATAPWANRHAALADADVVIVATGAPEPVLRVADLPARSTTAPAAFLIDISVPRNIDPAIDGCTGYRVCDLDALRAWTEQVEAQRSTEIPAAETICDEILSEFVTWVFHQQALQPAIGAIRETFEAIRTQEVERHGHRVEGLDRQELDRLTQSIMQKLLAVPIVRLKNTDPDSIDFVRGIKLLHALFSRPGCEDPSAQHAGAQPLAEQRPHTLADACPFHAAGEEDATTDALLERVMRMRDEADATDAPAPDAADRVPVPARAEA